MRRGVDHLLEEAKHGGLQRMPQMRDVIVLPIGGEGVLDEIVGADAEEVDFAREQIGGHRRARRFQHDPERHARSCATPSAARSARTLAQIASARRSSSGPVTSGNMRRTGPDADAR